MPLNQIHVVDTKGEIAETLALVGDADAAGLV